MLNDHNSLIPLFHSTRCSRTSLSDKLVTSWYLLTAFRDNLWLWKFMSHKIISLLRWLKGRRDKVQRGTIYKSSCHCKILRYDKEALFSSHCVRYNFASAWHKLINNYHNIIHNIIHNSFPMKMLWKML